MDLQCLTIGPFASNCYLLRGDDAAELIVVDPGGEPDVIIEAIRDTGYVPGLYLLTHGHVDHVHALADVASVFPAPVAMHKGDRDWAFTPAAAMPPYYDAPRPPPSIDRDLEEGQTWTDAGITYRVIETPGHSPGGVCFHIEREGILIGGDTLFRGSIGRSDLPFAEPRALWNSLQTLMQLPDETLVYPGHGLETTIGEERRHNPFLRDDRWAR